MSCQKLTRQSLHMVLNSGRGLYSFSHMDVSRLFYPSKKEALAADCKAKEKKNVGDLLSSMGKLPEPSVHYQPFRFGVSNNPNMFGLFGKSKIICSDAMGYTGIYNAELNSYDGAPVLNSPKGPKCMAISIPRTATHARADFAYTPDVDSSFFREDCHDEHTDSLYVMDMDSDSLCSFEVFAYYPTRGWRWRPLPPPPFFSNPEYKAPNNIPFTVVDGSMICVSSNTCTYSFDTVRRQWKKVGDWVLPFHAKAEYVPELRLWLGLLDCSPYNLCAFDLSGVIKGSCDMLTRVQDFELDVDLVGGCSLKNVALVNLGSGRFCIARFFDVINAQGRTQMVVLTGVEVEFDDHHGFRMISHKFECLPSDHIEFVF